MFSSITDIRESWPRGLRGTIAYTIDHRLFGFSRPVDWSSADLCEGHFEPGTLLFNGGFALLNPLEKKLLLSLKEFHIKDSEMTCEQTASFLANPLIFILMDKLGATDLYQLKQLAKEI